MKSIIVFLILIFSFLSLAPNMQGIQLIRLNEMINHYEKDLKNDQLKITNFLDFLNEHYNKIIDLEVDDHKKLPFKSKLPIHIELAIDNQEILPITIFYRYTFKKKNFILKNELIFDNKLNAIWNPPRV